MLKYFKPYYSLYILNYFLSFIISALWLLDYEDSLTSTEKFGLYSMDWDVKIAFIILNIVKFPFGFLLNDFNYGFLIGYILF